jgi:AcrR family transcriptional regulator
MRTNRTKEEFFAELSDLIKREGVSELGAGEIAARLRCSRRRLYEVASSKDGLLLKVAQHQFDTSIDAGRKAADAESKPEKSLMAYLNSGLRSAESLGDQFLKDLQQLEQGKTMFDEYQIERSKGARKILDLGARSGVFKNRNFDVVTEVLLGAAFRLRNPEFLNGAGLTVTQAFSEAYALVLQGLLTASNIENDFSEDKSSFGGNKATKI